MIQVMLFCRRAGGGLLVRVNVPALSLQQGFWSSLGVQQHREEHCPPDSSGITQELIFAFPIQHHFLSLEQRSRKQSLLTTHCAATSPLPQDRKQQLDHFVCFLSFFFLSREKAIYHLRRLTALTIFQPFWHRFFWNCLKTSATLVALFKCTSRESFRRSEAWTFTILEGWTRQAKRKKCLKKDCYQSNHQVSKQIGECEELNLFRQLFREFRLVSYTQSTGWKLMEAPRWALWINHQCSGAVAARGALCSPSACAGALCCSNPALTPARMKIALVRRNFDELFCTSVNDSSEIHLNYLEMNLEIWVAGYWIPERSFPKKGSTKRCAILTDIMEQKKVRQQPKFML